jgi:hypothetical protein
MVESTDKARQCSAKQGEHMPVTTCVGCFRTHSDLVVECPHCGHAMPRQDIGNVPPQTMLVDGPEVNPRNRIGVGSLVALVLVFVVLVASNPSRAMHEATLREHLELTLRRESPILTGVSWGIRFLTGINVTGMSISLFLRQLTCEDYLVGSVCSYDGRVISYGVAGRVWIPQ